MSEPLYNLNLEDRDELVERLLGCNRDETFWDRIVSDIAHENSGLADSLKKGETGKTRVTYLVERALDFPGAMDLLLNCVRNWATRDAAWRRLASHALMTL
ncbi:MAG: hypothetical protein ACKV2V_08050, partial [Blastocatellia bacterium]